MPIAVARKAGPNVRALGDRLLDAVGFDIVEGAALPDLLQRYPVLVFRSESAGQPQAHAVSVPVALEQLIPSGGRAGDRLAVYGKSQLAARVIGIALKQPTAVQHVVAIITAFDGRCAF